MRPASVLGTSKGRAGCVCRHGFIAFCLTLLRVGTGVSPRLLAISPHARPHVEVRIYVGYGSWQCARISNYRVQPIAAKPTYLKPLFMYSVSEKHLDRVVDGSKVIFFAITVRPKSDTM